MFPWGRRADAGASVLQSIQEGWAMAAITAVRLKVEQNQLVADIA
jgi:hypothetical protein